MLEILEYFQAMPTSIDSLSETIAVFVNLLQILLRRNKYLNRQKRPNKHLTKLKTKLPRTLYLKKPVLPRNLRYIQTPLIMQQAGNLFKETIKDKYVLLQTLARNLTDQRYAMLCPIRNLWQQCIYFKNGNSILLELKNKLNSIQTIRT